MKKVSIIVPVYNVEPYLAKCIDSILAQTYKNIELILVNDGSTDGCGNICDRYAEADSRIQVIHKSNGGLSDARNAGIDVAIGDYMIFVDSDDYVHHSLVDRLVRLAQDNDASIAVADFQPVFENDSPSPDSSLMVANAKTLVLECQDALEAMLYERGVTVSACVKLYRRKLFDKIRYPKGDICEDLGTTYKVLAKSAITVVSSEKLYFYLHRSNSISKSPFNPKRMIGLQFAIQQMNYVEKNFPVISKSARNRLFAEAIFIAQTITRDGTRQHAKYWVECKRVMRQHAGEVLRDRKSRRIYRIYAAASLVSPSLIYFVDNSIRIINNLKKIVIQAR